MWIERKLLKGLYYLKTIFFSFLSRSKSMWLSIMKVCSWFIQARHLKNVWFVFMYISFFKFIFFFSWPAAMLVGISNMFGIIQTCVMVSLIFLRRKNKNSFCICPAMPPDSHRPAARGRESSKWLSFLWKGLWPGPWVQLPGLNFCFTDPRANSEINSAVPQGQSGSRTVQTHK